MAHAKKGKKEQKSLKKGKKMEGVKPLTELTITKHIDVSSP